jgi:hypothetical protein
LASESPSWFPARQPLAWAAVVLSVAGPGMATLAVGLPEQRQPNNGLPQQRPADRRLLVCGTNCGPR